MKTNKNEIKRQIAALQSKLRAIEDADAGNVPTAVQARLMRTQKFSYGVHFERRKELRKGKSPGMINVSVRTFTSRAEAQQHGSRFTKKHNHVGFDVVRVNKRANAWINWRTGKTNPAI